MYHITFNLYRRPKGKFRIFCGPTKNTVYSTRLTLSIAISSYNFSIRLFNKDNLIKELEETKQKVKKYQIDALYGRNQ